MVRAKITLLFLSCLACAGMAQPTELPGAQAGKCYAKCLVHDKFEIVTENLMLRPAYSELTVVPATFETVTGHYAARESYVRLVAEPAVFETVEEKIQVAPAGRNVNPDAYEAKQEQILVKPAVQYYAVTEATFQTVEEPVEIEAAYMELQALPRQFQTVVDRVEVRPATTRWVRKNADRDCLSADPEDCFVWCMVEAPAEYRTFIREIDVGCDGKGSDDCGLYNPIAAKTKNMPVQKVAVPARAEERTEPAEYQTITRWTLKPGAAAPAADGPGEFVTIRKKQLKTPAQVREEVVPAEYKTIQRKVVKTPAEFRSESMVGKYVSIHKRKLVQKGGFSAWREIICSEKMTGYTVRQIQEALRALGYYKGAANGTMNPQTKAAIAQFQQERDLPADGNIDFETLKALGIQY